MLVLAVLGWLWILTYFDDFVAGELEVGDVAGVAGHKVAVEDAEDGFVCD